MRFNLGPFLILKLLLVQTSEEKTDYSPLINFFKQFFVEMPGGKHILGICSF